MKKFNNIYQSIVSEGLKSKGIEFDGNITKYNLAIHQLINEANLVTMLDYLDDMAPHLEEDRSLKMAHEAVYKFVRQLAEQSRKIGVIVRDYEDNLKAGDKEKVD